MKCSIEQLKTKEVIDIETGERLGYIDDAEFDVKTSEISSLIIYGRGQFFGIFGKESDITIPCGNIKVIGDDVILVNVENKILSNSTKDENISIKSLFK